MIPTKTIIKTGIVLLIVGAFWYLLNQVAQYETRVDRLNADKASLLSGMTTLENSNNELLYQAKGLLLDKEQLNLVNDSLLRQLKSFKIKYEDATSVITAQQKVIIGLRTKLKDSIIVVKTDSSYRVDTIKCFNYADKYNKVEGCIEKDEVAMNIQIQAPLVIVVENEYKHKFLWWKWKVINQKVNVMSPNKSLLFTEVKLYIPN